MVSSITGIEAQPAGEIVDGVTEEIGMKLAQDATPHGVVERDGRFRAHEWNPRTGGKPGDMGHKSRCSRWSDYCGCCNRYPFQAAVRKAPDGRAPLSRQVQRASPPARLFGLVSRP